MLAPSAANATLQYAARFNGNGASTVFVCADQAACDQNAALGNLAIPNPLTINGITKRAADETSTDTGVVPGGFPGITSSALAIINTTNAPVTLTVSIGDNNFLAPGRLFTASGSGTFTNAMGGTITDNWYVDPSNAQGAITPVNDPGIAIVPVDSQTFTATNATSSYSFNVAGALASILTSDFGMTLEFVLTLPASTAASCLNGLDLTTCAQLTSRGQNLQVTAAVPEPTTLVLLGGGLTVLGMLRGRSRRS